MLFEERKYCIIRTWQIWRSQSNNQRTTWESQVGIDNFMIFEMLLMRTSLEFSLSITHSIFADIRNTVNSIIPSLTRQRNGVQIE